MCPRPTGTQAKLLFVLLVGATACQSDEVAGPDAIGPRTENVSAAAVFTFIHFRAGSYNTCLNRGPTYTLMCWGSNSDGTVGIGTTGGSVLSPRAISNTTGGQSWLGDVGLRHQCSLFLVTGGPKAYCWGANYAGQLGTGNLTSRNTPTLVSGGIVWKQISTGYHHTCGISDIGVAYCWGRGSLGVLGNGGTADKLVPTPVNTGIAFASIHAGENFTCGRAQGTTVAAIYCWGNNSSGQLGIGTTTSQLLSPGPAVVGGAKWTDNLTLGSSHACALSSPLQTYCWGYNGYGQVGVGSTASQRSPIAVGVTVAPVAAGGNHTCGRQTGTGKMYCWGRGDLGALGNGFFINRLSPYPVLGDVVYSQDGSTLAAGANHTIAKRADNVVVAWGYNNFGQVGDGTTNTRGAPVVIMTP